MTGFTEYLETSIRDWMSQGTAFPSAPSALEVSLHTADPTDSPDGSTEVSASDYARVSVSAGSGWTTVGVDGFENTNIIDFGTTQNDWGSVSHAALSDGSGNWLATTSVSNGGSIPSGTDVYFEAGQLTFTSD